MDHVPICVAEQPSASRRRGHEGTSGLNSFVTCVQNEICRNGQDHLLLVCAAFCGAFGCSVSTFCVICSARIVDARFRSQPSSLPHVVAVADVFLVALYTLTTGSAAAVALPVVMDQSEPADVSGVLSTCMYLLNPVNK